MIFVLVVFALVWGGAVMVDGFNSIDREKPFQDGFFTALWVTPALLVLGWVLNG